MLAADDLQTKELGSLHGSNVKKHQQKSQPQVLSELPKEVSGSAPRRSNRSTARKHGETSQNRNLQHLKDFDEQQHPVRKAAEPKENEKASLRALDEASRGRSTQRQRMTLEQPSGVQKKKTSDQLLLSAIRSTLPRRPSTTSGGRIKSSPLKLPLSQMDMAQKHAEAPDTASISNPKAHFDNGEGLVRQHHMQLRQLHEAQRQQQQRRTQQLGMSHTHALHRAEQNGQPNHIHNQYRHHGPMPFHAQSMIPARQPLGVISDHVSSSHDSGGFAGFGRGLPHLGASHSLPGVLPEHQVPIASQWPSSALTSPGHSGVFDARLQSSHSSLSSNQLRNDQRLQGVRQLLASKREAMRQQQLLQQLIHTRQSADSSSVQLHSGKPSRETSPHSLFTHLNPGASMRHAQSVPGPQDKEQRAGKHHSQVPTPGRPSSQQQTPHSSVPEDLGHNTDPAAEDELQKALKQYGF